VKGSRRVVALWATALTLLVTLGLLCWLVVAPLAHTHAVVSEHICDWELQNTREARKAIALLGGRREAAARLKSYILLPERLSTERGNACALLVFCGRPGGAAAAEVLRKGDPLARLVLLIIAFDVCEIGLGSDMQRAFLGEEKLLVALAESIATDSEDRPCLAKDLLICAGPQASAATPVLARHLWHASEIVRYLASDVLLHACPPRRSAVPALLAALGDEVPEIRRNAVMVLGTMKSPPPEVTAALEGMLRDQSPDVRRTAAASLGRAQKREEG
jgi:hypothetical protein